VIRFRRYPSKNCVRLTAEVERMTGERVDWDWNHGLVKGLRLRIGDFVDVTQMMAPDALVDEASADAIKREMLVLARSEIRRVVG
jgi:hypothetical protein